MPTITEMFHYSVIFTFSYMCFCGKRYSLKGSYHELKSIHVATALKKYVFDVS